ncbi:hypothetical protein BCV69DRAFT_164561 [Microstroma glucosiphilum]|uniref:Uncharacterized protein n=1 Tax=Pseudomicrostroma glucosiphilum TaxID=1684307 RepID=A0A316U8U7_9BASI|nr:hypothetical protein BCV69DRAFT_164561 [Pseudomicrostroma glucosiphilum]PWN21258.1 hypothetical protein BCV69DRAFT_164561 [Pseudomicrostroma glucosiphilum]
MDDKTQVNKLALSAPTIARGSPWQRPQAPNQHSSTQVRLLLPHVLYLLCLMSTITMSSPLLSCTSSYLRIFTGAMNSRKWQAIGVSVASAASLSLPPSDLSGAIVIFYPLRNATVV